MTRHSNTLVFGTNTTIGLGIGNDATSTPSIDIGFRRQEVALVPLLANTHQNASGLQQLLAPCPLPVKIKANDAEALTAALNACHFRATINGHERDSYSVLASFGTKTTAEKDKGTVAIAQYFATGVAAQQLAKTGGANVIRAGDDAGEIAKGAAAAQDLGQEIESNNEKLATAYRESINLWVLETTNVRDATSGNNDAADRRKRVTKYIQEEFGADPGIGLLWLNGASTQQLNTIKEQFDIPVLAQKTRHELLSELFESSIQARLEWEAQQNSAVNKIASCISKEKRLQSAKDAINENLDKLDPDEIETLSTSISGPNITNKTSVKAWVDSTQLNNKDHPDLLAKIIIYYIAEVPYEDDVDKICKES